jgi:hypothetical protein
MRVPMSCKLKGCGLAAMVYVRAVSGKKFKKCHLAMPSIGGTGAAPRPLLRVRHHHEEMLREANFGKIRLIIQVPEYAGKRMVVARNRIYRGDKEKWRFFSDFLFHYVALDPASGMR